jgi:hypothetical protein
MRRFVVAGVVTPLSLASIAVSSRAAGEKPLTLDNIVVTLGATTYRIPHMEIEGASLPWAELTTLFLSGDKNVAARLARVSARRIVLPAMSSESRNESRVERAAYRKLELENVVSGRAAIMRADGGEETIESTTGGVQRLYWGVSEATGVYLPARAGAGRARHDADAPLKPLVDEEMVESTRLEGAGGKFVVTTGRVKLAGVRGRALQIPASKLIERFEKLNPAKPEDDPALMRDVLDALRSFEAASIDVDNVVATGKGEPEGKPFTSKIARFGLRKVAGAGAGEILIEDFSLAASDGGNLWVKRLTLNEVRLAPVLQGGAYPSLARFDMRGAAADLPDPQIGETSRIKFSIDNASATFGNFIETTPTKFSGRIDNFIVDLAARGETQTTAHFLALGYRNIALSGLAAAEWREKTSEAALEPVVIDAKDMGAAAVSAHFGNVSSAAFSSSPAISRAAMLTTSIKSADLTLEGGGLVDRMLALEAKERKTSVEQARADYAKAATTAIAALVGAGANASRLAEAVAAYIEKPKRLHLHLVAPKGINALDALTRKPGEILESLDVDASAD